MNPKDVCVVITSHNDADTIGDCLASARGLGCAVVVDSFSTDGTASIAREAGAVVYMRPAGDAAGQKNWALGRATGRWILSLDGCEKLGDGLAGLVEEAGDVDADAYALGVRNEYLGKVMTGRAAGPGVAVRLIRAGDHRFSADPLDATGASVRVGPTVEQLDGFVVRRRFRNVQLHFEEINTVTTTAARQYVDRGGRLAVLRMLLEPTVTFWRLYLARGGIRDGARGLMFCMLSAYQSFIKYAKAWELGVRGRGGNTQNGEEAG
ncbi:MAG: glycosyltransferase family 2 protein [Candidatus Latescibacterota bacterium]